MKNHFNLDCASDQLIRSSQEEEERLERKLLVHSKRFDVRSSSQRTFKLRPNESLAGFSFLLTLFVEGRTVIGASADIGFLHQGLEEKLESKTFTNAAALLRQFRGSPSSMSVAFDMASQSLNSTPRLVTRREQLERLIAVELERIEHHVAVMESVYRLIGDSRESALRHRLLGKAKIEKNFGVSLGLSGITLRAAGLADDLRLRDQDLAYELFGFKATVRSEGDAYARIMVRLDEIEKSKSLVQHAQDLLEKEPEDEIKQPLRPKYQGVVSKSLEAPEGELTVTVCANGSDMPYRVRIKTPSFSHLSAVSAYLTGADIDDVVLMLCTLGIDSLELDR